MATIRLLVFCFVSTVVLAFTTGATMSPTQVVSRQNWTVEPSSHTPYTTAFVSGYLAPHLPWNDTSPHSWNTTRILQSTGTASVSRPTSTVTVGEAGQLVFSPSSLNASPGSIIAFNFLGLNHTLTQSDIWNPCHSNQGFDTGFRQFNPANVSGKFVVEIEVTSQDAKWFFCAQTVKRSHCRAGMVFSLNPHGAHDQFLHNALAGIGITSTPTRNACSPPSNYPTANTSTHMAPTGTLSAGPSKNSTTISPPIFNSAGTTVKFGVWFVAALAFL